MVLRRSSGAGQFSRLREISAVMIRHGFGDLVRRAGLASMLERAGQVLYWREPNEAARLSPQQRVRESLEELGPTFVKLGQLLSMREDLLSQEWTEELEQLHSQVAPVPFEELLPQIEEALGKSPFDVFTDLDTEPHAAASIAQVHRAKLPNGAPVILKIRRPGIQEKIDADLAILEYLAELAENELPEVRRIRPTQIILQFRRSLERELDLAAEARNIERFARNFSDDPNVMIPQVYWDWTSTAMNVQEFVDGIEGTDLAGIDAAGLDRKVLAERGADCFLKMILVDGFFHADPHPGNVFYLPGERMALIDFGMVGRLTPQRRNQIIDLLGAIANHDDEGMVDVLLDWTGEKVLDEGRLAQDAGELAFDYADMPLKDVRVGTVLHRVSAIMRDHSVMLPPDLTLMFKAMISLEGLGRRYDTDFRLMDRLEPFLQQALSERYRPEAALRRGRDTLGGYFNLLTSLPRDASRLVKDLRRGRMRIDLDLKRLDSFGQRLDKTIDRMTVGIMTASLVIGSAIVMSIGGGPIVLGMPLLTLLSLGGFFMAFVNSCWIFFSIWRAWRR